MWLNLCSLAQGLALIYNEFMLPKAIVAILISLHILQASTPQIPIPIPTPISEKLTTPIKAVQSGISIPDLVYADLALQHELGHVSVYYFDDNPQNTISFNSDKNWDPASTIKLYVAMYAFDQVSHGKISLDQLITVIDKNVAPSQSFPNGYTLLKTGDTLSVYELLDRMITQSGNTSYNTLLDLLGRQEITKYIHDLGLTNSSVGAKLNLDEDQQQYEAEVPGYGPNLVTANDYAKAFILINGGRIPGSTDLFNILARQKFNSMIPALLPKNVTVAHKTGELDPYYHDGGIVTDSKRRYVLSVFSDMGDPNVIAHISDLIYTIDANLIGNNQKSQNTSDVPNPPIDPLVAAGEPQNTSVLAANTQNFKMPKITATDLGINASDLSLSLNLKELPPVIIPVGSPLHFLVDLGEQIRTNLNPVPSLRINFETQNLKLKLAEANDLLKKGHKDEANNILKYVDDSLAKIAKDKAVTGNVPLQSLIDQVSETRFSILGSEISVAENQADKLELIKEVAKQTQNTNQNVKPFVSDATKTNTLSQVPLIGKVVNSTINSITIKTSDGSEVTTAVDTYVKAREVGQNDSQVINAKEIAIGSTIALAGGNSNEMKPSFILTNISSDTANSTPVTVLKVNKNTNTMVIATGGEITIKVNQNNQTVIKGSDTTISLSELKPGDVVVVHGEALPASPSATILPSSSPRPTSTPTVSGSGTPIVSSSTPNGTSVPLSTSQAPTTTPKATTVPTKTNTPTATTAPQGTATPTKTNTPVVTAAPKTTPPPTIIKGFVIDVVHGSVKPTPQPF